MSSKQEISQKFANQGLVRLRATSYNPEHVLIAVIRQSFGVYLQHSLADWSMADSLGTCKQFCEQLVAMQSEIHRVLNNEVSAQELLNAWLSIPELPIEGEIFTGVDL